MKSSDLPILQFFSKQSNTTSTENAHDMIDDIDDEDETEEFSSEEAQHTDTCPSIHKRQDEEDSNSGVISCPVCHKMLLGDNERINQHIDLCLNGEMVRTTIKEEDQRTSPQINHSKRYDSASSCFSTYLNVCICQSWFNTIEIDATSETTTEKTGPYTTTTREWH